MSASNNTPVLAERNDIHKSCRSIEALLTVLNEYCDAAGAIVVLQKKLSKALRETAGLKVTGDIAANAMNLSANIFEALSEVDTKFAKLADREYDGVSTEVKKWFKKLTKEEKAHDERMANANARIKQAGQNYEKKSKKRGIDAGEEHARYINLISVLGPEMSQDKYNHHLHITKRHATTTYNVAASLARLAEVEWQKSCECTRRFSPNIGPLGRFRVLCEGGWTGDVPSDLPNIDQQGVEDPEPQTDTGPPTATTSKSSNEPPPRHAPQSMANLAPPEPVRQYTTSTYQSYPSTENLNQDPRTNSRSQSSAGNSPIIPRQIPVPINETLKGNGSSASLARTIDELEPPPDHLFDPRTGSVRSLSAFPAPPTHLPPHPPFPRHFQNSDQASSPLVASSSSPRAHVPLTAPVPQYISESPVSEREEQRNVVPARSEPTRQDEKPFVEVKGAEPVQEPTPPSDAELGFRASRDDVVHESQGGQVNMNQAPLEIRRPIPRRSETTLSALEAEAKKGYNDAQSSPVKATTLTRFPRGDLREDVLREDEFGAGVGGMLPKARTMDVASKYTRTVERTDTGTSNGSVVAALRNRYSITSESVSPPPRDLPKVPLSVNTLVSKYQDQTSPRLRTSSPPVSRQQSLPALDNAVQQSRQAFHDRIASPTNNSNNINNNIQTPIPRSRSPPADESRRQRLSDSQERARKAKEQELRQREMELDRRSQELERERTRLNHLRETDERYEVSSANTNGQGQGQAQGQGQGSAHEHYARARERRTSLRQRPSSHLDSEASDGRLGVSRGNLMQRAQFSHSATHLVPPNQQTTHSHQQLRGSSQPSSPLISDSETHSSQQRAGRHHDSGGSFTNHSGSGGSTNTGQNAHASCCGCETCSIQKYKSSGQQQQQQASTTSDEGRQRRDSKPEKTKSWIRRLSMPVGNAFGSSGETKKHGNNNSISGPVYALGAGITGGPTTGRGLFSLDGRRNLGSHAFNASVESVATRRTSANEDGYLKGAPVQGQRGQQNRSTTNLGRH